MVENLTTLWALRDACAGLQSAGARGSAITARCREQPYLADYLRATYDPALNYGCRSDACRVSPALCLANPPTLLQLLRKMATEGTTGLQAQAMWAWFIQDLKQPELRRVANMILDRDLQCGITPHLLNQVFQRLGQPPMQPPPDLSIELYGDAQGGVWNGDLFCGGQRAGTVQLHLCPPGKAAVAALRKAGVVVVIPAYGNSPF